MTVSIDGTYGIVTPNVTDSIQPITASVASSALTVTLNPTSLAFRSATLTSGTVNTRQVPNAISVVVPASATLGTVSAQQSRIVVLALDNAGTVELAVVNISGGVNLTETNLITTTAISAGSTSASTVYSTNARTSVPYRVVGYVESTQATAGTWATTPSTLQGQGGQALSAMSSIGYGQTWQSVTRTSGTTYYNTTGRPIFFTCYTAGSGTGTNIQANINGSGNFIIGYCNLPSGVAVTEGHTLIPAGASYVITVASGALTAAYELR